MEYSNPEIPEGINVSKTHPLKEMAWLTAGLLGVLLALMIALGLAAEYLAGWIPFEQEQQWARSFAEQLDAGDQEIQRDLQRLADRVSVAMELPDEMRIQVHYVDEDTINAFATLGGHLVFYRGLLEKMPNENALTMVMAHEIAHVAERHPIRSLGRGVGIGLALALVTGSSGNDVLAEVMDQAGLLTLLSYSRAQEREADEAALHAVHGLYGHVGGADTLFHILHEARDDQGEPVEFFSTHPLDQGRIDDAKRLAEESGYARQGNRQPLSKALAALRP